MTELQNDAQAATRESASNAGALPCFDLSEEEKDFFFKNGYVKPFKVYEPEEVDAALRKVRVQLLDRRNAVYQQDTQSHGNNLANYDRHLDIPFLGQHICNPRIVHRVRSLLGKDVLCWRSEFFPKNPGDPGTDWHQAATFKGLAGKPHIIWPDDVGRRGTLTAWFAFTDVTRDMAPLGVVPGTHNMMHYDEEKRLVYNPDRNNTLTKNGIHRGMFGYDYRDLQFDPNWTPDESKAVYFEMKKGEAVLFWSTILHCSLPHLGQTKNMRLGYAARFVPPQVLIHPDSDVLAEFGGEVSLENYGAVVVAGENNYTHNRIRATNTLGQPFVPVP